MSVEKTQAIFADLIKKPQLTTQLLTRPPFKFIVDIVSNVIKSTGYLESVFSHDKLAASGNDKNTKTEFLDELINILDDDGSLKSVKSAKILSGKDSEGANKLLQKLGENAANFRAANGDTKKKSEEKTSKKESSSESGKVKKEKSSKSKSSDKDKEEKKSSKSKEKSKEKDKEKSSEKVKKPKKVKKKDNDGVTNDEGEQSKHKKKDHVLKRADSMIAINGDVVDSQNDMELQDDGYHEQEIVENDNQNNELAVNQNTVVTTNIEAEETPALIKPENLQSLIRPTTGAPGGRPMTSMGRPGTATSRPAPPKLKKKQIATVDSTPQTNIELKSKIINEQDQGEKVEDDTFVMENEVEESFLETNKETAIDEEDRGVLVQKIIDMKSEIEDGAAFAQQNELDNDKTTSIEQEKVRALQEKLQDLTRSAFPLARLFDFANDDIESMIKELERWRSEQRRQEQETQNKKASGFGDNSRFFNIISNLQKDINDYKEELSKTRGRVLKNEKRIQLFIYNF